MSFTAFLLILFSTMFHAGWNGIAKKNKMSVPFYAIMVGCCLLCWCHVFFWTPVSYAALPCKFWLQTICTVSCDLGLYSFGLTMVYRYFPMSTVYPIMRSLPILLTFLVTAMLGQAHAFSAWGIVGMLIVCIGCLHMPLSKYSDFSPSVYCSGPFLFVLMAAMGTTGYTIFDRMALGTFCATFAGQGISRVALSLSFYVIRELFLSVGLLLVCACHPVLRRELIGHVRQHDWHPVVAGCVAGFSYGAVLLAMTYVTNVTYVQIFRQMGLPVGMLVGIIFLKEKAALVKFIGCALIVAGLICCFF